MPKTAAEIREKYPDRIPVFVRYGAEMRLAAAGERLRDKFLVPQMLTAAQLYAVIRTHAAVSESEALFFTFGVSNTRTIISMPDQMTLRRIYDDFHAPDMFLYMNVDAEHSLG